MKAQNRNYVLIGFFASVSFLLTGLVAYPLFIDIQESSAGILADKKEVLLAQMQREALMKFKDRSLEYQPALDQIDRLFVDAENPVDFIKFLEGTALGSGMEPEINLISTPEDSSSPAPAVTLQIITRGEFSSIVTFAERLENGPYLMKIKDIALKKFLGEPGEREAPPALVEAAFLVTALAR